MPELLTKAAQRIHRLSEDVSAMILDEAIEGRAAVRIGAPDGDGPEMTGRIASGDAEALAVELHAPPHDIDLDEAQVSLFFGSQRYLFPARCLRPAGENPRPTLYLVRPARISAVQRRRSRRYRFQEPILAVVFIPAGGEEKPQAAAMLNLSPEGVACRMPRESLGDRGIGDCVRVRLTVGGSAEVFELEGRVTNITQAGSPGQVVLGLEFVADQRSQPTRRRLRRTLSEMSAEKEEAER